MKRLQFCSFVILSRFQYKMQRRNSSKESGESSRAETTSAQVSKAEAQQAIIIHYTSSYNHPPPAHSIKI